MGDAGLAPNELAQIPSSEQENTREIHVLVTGFGAFNTFTTNPSWLIASALPKTLEALPDSTSYSQPEPQTQQPALHPLAALLKPTQPPPQQTPSLPLRPPNTQPYRIHVHTYPSPLRVAYASTATVIPSLLNPQTNPEHISYDYILHIGLASGRDSYTLETQAHRDNYIIPDIDGAPGFLPGEKIWRALGIPDRLDIGWESTDVLRRWVREVDSQQPEPKSAPAPAIRGGARPSIPRRAVVKLSRDAGRFLCEFVLMSSLAWRWRDQERDETTREKIGKVAFLHVPNGIETPDVQRGVMVAESAIRSLVASWEAGYRNPLVYAPLPDSSMSSVPVVEKETQKPVIDAGFETKGTGDAMPTTS